jgi:folate-dependent phosphoribosylglycinamide formyltransferase PurN
MRALILTSNSLRHKYFANKIAEKFNLKGIISEKKSNYYIEAKEKSLFVKNHFALLTESEEYFFSEFHKFPDVPILRLNKKEINSDQSIQWAKKINPEIVFLFGTVILSNLWLNQFPVIINTHLGLSPFYKGSATLFWPFFNDEISCVGATIHLAEKNVDAGPILKRIKPDLEVGDDYYKINYKTIKKVIDILPGVTMDYIDGKIKGEQQVYGHYNPTFKKSDFNEVALETALSNIGGGLSLSQIEKIKKSRKCNY